MAKVSALVVLRTAALLALLGSSALTVDYMSPVPTFCGATGGCSAVRTSGWGYLGAAQVPLPALGLVAYTVVLTLSLLPGRRRHAAAPVALAGGIAAVGLLAVQWLAIGAFCLLCVTVDSAALVAAAAGAAFLWWPARNADAAPSNADLREPLQDRAWIGLGVLAVAAPLLWSSLKPAPDVPPEIAAHYVPGKINVVEFVDFECPFCRLYHPVLKQVAAEYPGRVHLVRLDLPLDMHPNARDAARAHVCAVPLGRGEELAELLIQTEDLSRAGVLKAGVKAGLEEKALDACMKTPETERAVGASQALLTRLNLMQGLPTTFVGSKMIVGTVEAPELRDAFDQALVGSRPSVPGPAYGVALLLAAGACVWFGRRR